MRRVHRHAGEWESWRQLRAVTLVLLAAFFVAFTDNGAGAQDATDQAVDAFVQVGSVAGIPIGRSEARIIKAIVRCAVNDVAIVTCARHEIILLLELPQPAADIANCALSATPDSFAACAGDQVIAKLPQARAALACIRDRADFGRCSAELALEPAQRQAFDVIDRLKADGRSRLESLDSARIHNIVETAVGIRDHDWAKVLAAAGPEVYKVAAKAVLKAVLPALMPLSTLGVDDAVDAIVQHRVDLVTGITKGAAEGNPRAVGEAIAEGYLMTNFVVPCALGIIPEEIRHDFCGTVGTVIRQIASFGGGLIDIIVNAVRDPLGIPAALWDELEKVLGTIAGKESDCVSPEQYYATNYAKCYHRAVRMSFPNEPQFDVVGSLNNNCRHHYDRCFNSADFDGLCNPQRAMFEQHVGELTAVLKRHAAIYSRSFEGFARSKGIERACDGLGFLRREFNEFLDACAGALATQLPIPGDPNQDRCWEAPMSMSRAVHRMACEQAMKRVDTTLILSKICHPTPRLKPPVACEGHGVCGRATITCQRPLPPATEFFISGDSEVQVRDQVEDVDIQGGDLSGHYSLQFEPHSFPSSVCARNELGTACSETFPLMLGATNDPICFNGPPPSGQCTSSQQHCGFGCILLTEVCSIQHEQ